MKSTIRKEIELEARKLLNIKSNIGELNLKIERLQEKLKELNLSVEKSEERIVLLGLKQKSKDIENPDSPESLEKKKKFNQDLQSQKKEILKQNSIEPSSFKKSSAIEELDESWYS